jgi:hypothetical protein
MLSRRGTACLLLFALSATVATASASAAAPGDADSARKIDLRLSDFPARWTARSGANSDTGCFSTPAKVGATAFVRAQVFLNETGRTEATGQVAAYATPAAARRALAAVAGPAPIACYRQKLPAQLTKGGVEVTRFVNAPLAIDAVGDHVLASRCTVSVKQGRGTGTLYVDSIFVQRGRFLIAAGFLGEVELPSVADERAALAKAVARVPATT